MSNFPEPLKIDKRCPRFSNESVSEPYMLLDEMELNIPVTNNTPNGDFLTRSVLVFLSDPASQVIHSFGLSSNSPFTALAECLCGFANCKTVVTDCSFTFNSPQAKKLFSKAGIEHLAKRTALPQDCINKALRSCIEQSKQRFVAACGGDCKEVFTLSEVSEIVNTAVTEFNKR